MLLTSHMAERMFELDYYDVKDDFFNNSGKKVEIGRHDFYHFVINQRRR